MGLPNQESPDDYLRHTRPLFDETIASGRALVVTDIGRDKHFRYRNLPPDNPTAFLCVPIKHGDTSLGTLSIERCAPLGSSFAADLRLLTLIARILAQAVQLRQEGQERIAELRQENDRLQNQIAKVFKPDNLIGNSNAMRSVYLHIEQVAGSETTVLIRGKLR